MTNSFIVYRNPVEAAVWEAIMSDPLIIISVFTFVIMSLVLSFILIELYKNVEYKIKKFSFNTNIFIKRALIVSSILISGWISFFIIPNL